MDYSQNLIKAMKFKKKYFAALSDFALQFVNRFINTDK